MKKFLLAIVCLNNISAAHAQVHKEDSGNVPIIFETAYTGDFFSNFSGGIKKGSAYLGMASFKISLNTETAGLWRGGELFVHAANTHGAEPTAQFIGDFQVASNIEAGALTYLHELRVRQNIGKASLLVGLQDLCSEFLSSDKAGLFLNSSCGVHSTIASNLSVPIFPLTSAGIQFHYNFSENVILKLAAFDGVPDDFSVNKHNLKWQLHRDDGFLSFSEVTYINSSKNKSGIYKAGVYYHNKYSIKSHGENGQVLTQAFPENYGIYGVLDQIVLSNESGKELSVFLQTSLSPSRINENWYHIGLGINYRGLIQGRGEDVSGIAFAHSGINNSIGSESVIELTYKTHFSENFYLQPDFQYIINPAGTDKKLKNAFVGFLRFGISI